MLKNTKTKTKPHRTQDSLLNYPLFITTRKKGFRWDRKHRKHYTPEHVCAESFVTKSEVTAIIFYPRPSDCPLDDVRSTVALLNHEFLHQVMELQGIDSDCLDDYWLLQTMAISTEDCQYCFCEDKV